MPNITKRPRILVAESDRKDGTHVLNLETGQEATIPWPPQYGGPYYADTRYAGSGPGYWSRVLAALQALGWKVEAEDFGAMIAVMILEPLVYPDSNLKDDYDEYYADWDRKKKAKIREIWDTVEW
jgi:hypothetical protein